MVAGLPELITEDRIKRGLFVKSETGVLRIGHAVARQPGRLIAMAR
jgi:hypothetical protein